MQFLSSYMSSITVIKLDIKGNETWRYSGQILHWQGPQIVLEAYFDRDDVLFHGMPLYKGDRFLETYFTDRWYNIYEIHSRADYSLRGWYCNVSFPARLDVDRLFFKDLALDLLVFPDGGQIILDEDEFARLELSAEDRGMALAALDELRAGFKQPEWIEALRGPGYPTIPTANLPGKNRTGE